MTDADWISGVVTEIAGRLHACNRCRLRRKGPKGDYMLPSRRAVHGLLDAMVAILFPGCHGNEPALDAPIGEELSARLRQTIADLQVQAEMAFVYQCERDECIHCGDCGRKARAAAEGLLNALPDIQEALQDDIQAAYEGDPAAKSPMEVVMSYPAIQAIAAHRIAHALYNAGVPLIPRIMSELAHSRTGIDIHPGAKIGRSFFIDHGTGVVIGETAVIGRHVKLYQGVTLGALSFPKGPDGRPIKGIKRHPEVRDHVTIYAEATILGGQTVIGEGSEIGGNVWLTHSVPPNSRVYNVQPEPRVRERGTPHAGEPAWFPAI
jgi:serine O-acetyltransferase